MHCPASVHVVGLERFRRVNQQILHLLPDNADILDLGNALEHVIARATRCKKIQRGDRQHRIFTRRRCRASPHIIEQHFSAECLDMGQFSFRIDVIAVRRRVAILLNLHLQATLHQCAIGSACLRRLAQRLQQHGGPHRADHHAVVVEGDDAEQRLVRLYVHESVYDELCNELVAIAKNTVVDDGSKQGTKLGPLQNKMQYEKVKAFLEDARKNGKVVAGGSAMDRPGYFIEPTIVRDIKEGSKLVDEEQFGPVLPLIKYSDKDDVIRRANATTYGLGASVWSSDVKRAHEVASQLESGTVWINKHLDMAPNIPFGGAKQSGIGTEFAEEGLAEFTQLQIINGPPAA